MKVKIIREIICTEENDIKFEKEVNDFLDSIKNSDIFKIEHFLVANGGWQTAVIYYEDKKI